MSLLKTVSKHELGNGVFEARVARYEEIEATEKSQAFVAVTISADNTEHTDRWYAARIPWLMRDLKRQLGLQSQDLTLEELLEIAKKQPFDITVFTDSRYGIQVAYTVDDDDE